MGGTFDPIHHGHLVAASEVQARFELDEVVFVPTGQPYEKGKVSPAEDRYLMTVIATASNPRFHVSRADIDRDGPTYTIDTLRDMRAIYGGEAALYFITGADALGRILSWKDALEMLAMAHFVGVTRPGFRPDRRPPAGRLGHPGRGAGHGHLLVGVPGPGGRREAGVVPGARRCCAVHQQARPLSGVGNCHTGVRGLMHQEADRGDTLARHRTRS